MKKHQRAIIFGGTGFIGTHLSQHILQHRLADEIILVDIKPPRVAPYTTLLQEGLASGSVRFVHHDVRREIAPGEIADSADIIFNLAAVHREPGHAAHEYYETNVLGAENVCEYATEIGCKRIVFTSSISPYGPTEDLKTESSLPVPETPYGGSKLVAERIHLGWQRVDKQRKLLTLRPGVVFGPGEGGNVTRLVRSIVKGYFVYMGNQSTSKAGGYVKELCNVIYFGLQQLEQQDEPSLILNFSTDPPMTMEQFVDTIREVTGVTRTPFSIPRFVLMGTARVIYGATKLVGVNTPLNPVRVRKLYRSTNIDPFNLRKLGYQYKYTPKAAFQDWLREMPADASK